jgi:hypothetical protein
MSKKKMFAQIKMSFGFVFVSIIITAILACGRVDYRAQTPKVNVLNQARLSFVKVTTTYGLSVTENSIPIKATITGYCSGTIVKIIPGKGSYVLTASHCTSFHNKPDAIKIESVNISVKDYDYIDHPAIVKNQNADIDVSLLFVPDLQNLPAITLADKQPITADIIYNISAPAGFYPKSGAIIIQRGYFSSIIIRDIKSKEIALYSLLAYSGQSGSMILNRFGQLIGMLHSAHTRAPIISLSPSYNVLKQFLTNNWNN